MDLPFPGGGVTVEGRIRLAAKEVPISEIDARIGSQRWTYPSEKRSLPETRGGEVLQWRRFSL